MLFTCLNCSIPVSNNLLCRCSLGLSFFHSSTLSLFIYLLYASQHGYIKEQTSRHFIFSSFMVFQPLNNIQTTFRPFAMPVLLGTFILSFIDPFTISILFICFPARLHQKNKLLEILYFLHSWYFNPSTIFRQHLDNIQTLRYAGVTWDFHSFIH